jgi:hypothetical protein
MHWSISLGAFAVGIGIVGLSTPELLHTTVLQAALLCTSGLVLIGIGRWWTGRRR